MSCIVTVDSALSGLGISFWEADRAYTRYRGGEVHGNMGRGGKRCEERESIAGQRFCNNALQLSALLISEG